jgi:hypothetical protein
LTLHSREASTPTNGENSSHDESLLALLSLLAGGALIAGVAAASKRPGNGGQMNDQNWEKLAWDELQGGKDGEEQIAAKASDITKLGPPVVALIGALLVGLGGSAANLDWTQGETVIAIGVIVSTTILGVLLIYANDFRTRGRVTVARLEAIANVMDSKWDREERHKDLADTNAKLAAVTEELEETREQLQTSEERRRNEDLQHRVDELEKAELTEKLAEARAALGECTAEREADAVERRTTEREKAEILEELEETRKALDDCEKKARTGALEPPGQEPENGPAEPGGSLEDEADALFEGFVCDVEVDTVPIAGFRVSEGKVRAYLVLGPAGVLEWHSADEVTNVREADEA